MIQLLLITEGVTDQAIVENILCGYFGNENISVDALQPIGDETFRNSPKSFGGWELVLKYCSSDDFKAVFQFPENCVVIQIDSDRCEDEGFGVSRRDGQGTVSSLNLIGKIEDRIREAIGQETLDKYTDRIVFAVAVDSTECWLLPLHAKDKMRTKETNCLLHLNRSLAKSNIATINPDKKTYRQYDELSKLYRKHKCLTDCCPLNPSLQLFVRNLEEFEQRLTSEPLPAVE